MILLLLEISLLFSGAAWACPMPPEQTCHLCPDNSFYSTDRCDDCKSGCAVIPPAEVLSTSTDPNECKQVAMDCPEGSMVVAGISGQVFGPYLWTEFKNGLGFTNFVCSDEAQWLITFGDTAGVLDYIYCYNRNCSRCPDIRAPTAAECDPADCQAPTFTYNPYGWNPGAECRRIAIECPTIPAGFSTANMETIYSTGSRQLISGDAGMLSCSNQAKWTHTSPSGIGKAISTIACHYT